MAANDNPHIRNAFGLTILKNSHRDIRQLRRQTGYPEIHGNKFWNASFLLMDYLSQEKPGKKARVLEIGCGWGLGGIFCAKAFQAQVTALDADPIVFPYLEHHATLNGVQVQTWRCRYEQVTKAHLAGFDMVIGADICFWESMVNPLYNLISRARQAHVGRIVIADPGRPTFSEVAERCTERLNGDFFSWSVPHPHNTGGVVLDISA